MPGKVKAYHTTDDGVVEVDLYQVDADEAVRKHPEEWSLRPPKGGKVVSANTGEEVTETVADREKKIADTAAEEAKAAKAAAPKGAVADGMQPSSPQTTERAGPTRRDPPFTEGAVRPTSESGQGPQLVTDHDNLGEVKLEQRREEGRGEYAVSARDRKKASAKARDEAEARRAARAAEAAKSPKTEPKQPA